MMEFALRAIFRFLSGNPSILALGLLYSTMASCQSKTMFLAMDSVQMATPRIEVDSVLFETTASVVLNLADDGALIKYTLDGSEVTESSHEYKEVLQLGSTMEIKAKAFHPNYLASKEQTVTVRKLGANISAATIEVDPVPHTNYPGEGAKTLVNRKKGTLNFRKGKNWLGFQENEIKVNLDFHEKLTVNKLTISTLQDQNSWIFAPQGVSVQSNGKKIGDTGKLDSGEAGKKKMLFLEVPVEKGSYQELTISISALPQIPDWHAGKGTLPWLFIDEIIVE